MYTSSKEHDNKKKKPASLSVAPLPLSTGHEDVESNDDPWPELDLGKPTAGVIVRGSVIYLFSHIWFLVFVFCR